MMSKNPVERPASCDEVRVELLKWSTGELARPMDEEGDANYRRAIWQLEAENSWPDLTVDLVPPTSARQQRRSRFRIFSSLGFGEASSLEPESNRASGLLLLEIGGLVLVGFGLIYMLYVASR
jgi:hypothetical protein